MSDMDVVDAKELRHIHRCKLNKSKLSHLATIMSFMCWFCILSITQLPVEDDINRFLVTSFIVINCLLVSVSGFVILVTAFILPYITANEALEEALDGTGLTPYFYYNKKYKLERNLGRWIQVSWILASTVSVFLFTLDVILLCWIKFSSSPFYVPASGSAILTPFLFLLLIFGFYFRSRLMNNKLFQGTGSDEDYDENAYRTYYSNYTHRRMSGAGVRIAMTVLGIEMDTLSAAHVKQTV